jgi:hypothetical protein
MTVSRLFVIPALMAFPAPAFLLLHRRAATAGDRTLEGVLDRICLSYAISIAALFLVAQGRLILFAPLWLAAAITAVVVAVRAPPPSWSVPLGAEGRILLRWAAIYFVLRCLPLAQRDFPIGWDPSFHLMVADLIARTGRAVHDLRPYENMPLNYPIGSHLLLAFIGWVTRLRSHRIFEAATALFTTLTGLQIFSLVSRAARDRGLALYAAFAYLWLAILGSLGYALWGGLPNLFGMYLFLGLVTYLVVEQPSLRQSTAVFVTFFLAVSFVHHHVMVTAGLTLAWMCGYLFVTGSDRPRARRIAVGLVAAGVAGAPYFLTYLWRAATLGQTGIGGYGEAAGDVVGVLEQIGLGFGVPVLAGLFLYFRGEKRLSPVLVQALVGMLVLYFVGEFLVRSICILFLHRDQAPFTPARFLTDAVTLMAVFAGVFFREMQGARASARAPILVMIVMGFLVFNRGLYHETFRREITPERIAAYEWIRSHADADAVLLDTDPRASYLASRMSQSLPLPSSEYQALATNRALLEDVAAGRKPAAATGRQVLRVEEGAPVAGTRLLWQHPSTPVRVVEVWRPPPPS